MNRIFRTIPLALFLSFSAFLSAQQLRFSSDSLNLGTHMKWENDSSVVWFYNQHTAPITIEDINVYGMDFYFHQDTSLQLAAGDSLALWVSFIPRHNIEYNGELVVVVKDKGAWKVDLRATGQYQGTYYTTTFNLSQEALKAALKTRLALNYTQMGYNTGRDWIFMSIDNKKTNGEGAAVNTLSCVYTGRTIENYVSRSDAQTNGNFNTEHTYPQSKFGNGVEPMMSDMFHLFAVDEGSNSRRSNHPFSVVLSPSWTEGGAKYGNNLFEPRDDQKGRSARAMLYFVVRYQNYDNFISTNVFDANGQTISQEALLRSWCAQFPPDVKDSLRNEAIFKLQKNRNPFIDHPEFLERIQSLGQNSVAPVIRGFETNIPSNTRLRFSSVSGDTTFYQLAITATGNTTIPISISTKNGTSIMLSSSVFNLDPNESKVVRVAVLRNIETSERDSLIIKSSAIAGSEKAYALEIDYFNVGLGNWELSGLNLYPNPNSGTFLIEKQQDEEAVIEIFTLQGLLVTSAVLNQPLNEISLPNPSTGLYFVHITQGQQVFQRHLLIR